MMLDQGTRLLEHLKTTSDPICQQKLRQEAVASLQRGMRPTPEMETNLIAALRQVGVTVIVAPYEADAQLAHLCLSGVCQACLTENFDIFLYSAIARCSFPLIFKFESTGASHVVSLKSLGGQGKGLRNLVEIPLPHRSSGLKRQLSIRSANSLHSCLNLSTLLHDPRLLLQLCLLSGCEFIDPVRGMTLSTALEVSPPSELSVLSSLCLLRLSIFIAHSQPTRGWFRWSDTSSQKPLKCPLAISRGSSGLRPCSITIPSTTLSTSS
jgi:hypothetical protein